MNILDVSVNLEDVGGVKTIRTTVYVGGRAVAMSTNVVSDEQVANLFTRDLMVSAQMGKVAMFIADKGIPNVSTTETPYTGAQGNRATEAVGEDTASTA